MTRIVPFSFTKDGVYYFTRRVPKDLKPHYETDRISFSLRTRNPIQATARSLTQSTKLDEFWAQLRLGNMNAPGSHRLLQTDTRKDLGPTAREALATYLRLKGKGRSATFETGATRAIYYLVASKKDKPLLAYTKTDATSFRDELFERGLASASVVRIFTSLRAVTSFALTEHGLSEPSPFTGIYLDRSVKGEGRTSIPIEDIRRIQAKCREIDDDMRWLVALISDTGMRLAEAAGLAMDDIKLDHEVPHLVVKPHPWRSLKTEASERVIPLVGMSLWAAERIFQTTGSQLAFNRYNKGDKTNANSASAALNKWLAADHIGAVIHGFRHSLRDRLRSVECPTDVADSIGGWTSGGIGQGYGNGYDLKVKAKWLTKIVLYHNSNSNTTQTSSSRT